MACRAVAQLAWTLAAASRGGRVGLRAAERAHAGALMVPDASIAYSLTPAAKLARELLLGVVVQVSSCDVSLLHFC